MSRSLPAHSCMPFAPVFDPACRVLVLGSHPSVISKREGFYYMNPQNRFWKVMSALFDEDFVAADIEQKKVLLLRHHIALYDVIASCDLVGSSDASIRNVVPGDIRSILLCANIQHIFLNGATAYKYFCRYQADLVPLGTVLPSSSAANARHTLPKLVQEWRPLSDAAKENK